MELFFAHIVVLETLSLIVFLYAQLRQRLNFYPSVALGFSIPSALLTYSLFLQIFFLLGKPSWIYLAEIAIALICISRIKTSCLLIKRDFRSLKISKYSSFVLYLLLIPVGYLYLQSVILLPNNHDSLVYNLARSLLYEDAGTLFPKTISDYTQVCYPIGNDILHYLFLRFDMQRGTGFFSFLAYLGCIFLIYSLVRTYYRRNTAICAAFIFACLPEIVFQATTPKNDLAVSLFALSALLAFIHYDKNRRFEDLFLITIFLAGGTSVKTTFLAFGVPFFLFFVIWCLKNKSLSSTARIFRQNPYRSAFLFCCSIIISQVWLFAYNTWAWGSWSGPPFFVNGNVNQDGLYGALANLCRYFAESFHLTQPVDFFCQKILTFSPRDAIQASYDRICIPLFGNTALAQPFEINWSQTEDTWFGPFGFALAWIGAPTACFVRKSPSRWVALLAFIFLFLVAYKVKWWSSNQRYLTCFFALSVVASAPMIDFLQKGKVVRSSIYAISIIVGLHAVLFNVTKPFFHFVSPRVDLMIRDSIANGTNVWSQTRWGEKTWWSTPIGDWNDLDLRGKTVGIVAANHHNHLNFITGHSETKFIGIAHDRGLSKEKYERIFSNDELNLEGIDFLLLLSIEHSIIKNAQDTIVSIFNHSERTEKKVAVNPPNLSLALHWECKPFENRPSYNLYRVIKGAGKS